MNRIWDGLQLTRRLVLTSLLLLVPVLIDINIRISAGPESKFRLFEYGVLLALLLSVPIWLKRRDKVRLNLLNASMLLWLGYVLTRAFFDTHLEFSFDYAFRTASWLLFAMLIADACSGANDFLRFIRLAAVVQSIPVIYALGQAFGVDFYFILMGENWQWHSDQISADRGVIWSSLGNPNFYASYGGMLLIWLVVLLGLSKRWWTRTSIAVYTVILIYTLIRTVTRGVWASLIPTAAIVAVLFIISTLIQRHSLRSLIARIWKPAIALTLLAAVVLGTAYKIESGQGPLHRITKRFYHAATFHDTSMRSRPLLWYAALRMWRESPVWGRGHGRYAPLYLPTVYQSALETDPERIQRVTRGMNTIRFDRAHNDYLQFLAETGMVGYTLFLSMMIFAVAFAIRGAFLSSTDRKRTILLYGCSAATVMTAIQCLYDFPLLLPASSLFFALALAGILILTRENQGKWMIRFPAFIRWIAALAVLPVFVFAGGLVIRHLSASHLHHKGIVAMETGMKVALLDNKEAYKNYSESHEYLSQALERFPGDGKILYELGRLDYVWHGKRNLSRAVNRLQETKPTFCIPQWFHLMGTFYFESHLYPQARQQSEALLLIDPDREETQFLAGKIDMITGDYQDAIAHFKEELRVNPTNDRAYAFLGQIYEDHFNNREQAVRAYEEQLNLKLAIDVLIHVAELYEELGDYELALERYNQARPIAKKMADKRFERQVEAGLSKLKRRMSDG